MSNAASQLIKEKIDAAAALYEMVARGTPPGEISAELLKRFPSINSASYSVEEGLWINWREVAS